MTIEKLIKINGTALPRVKKYSVGYELLWSGAERNMAGSLNADFVGEFPKIELEFADGLSQDDVNLICGLLSQPFFMVEYWDSRLNQYTSGKYYRGNYNLEIMNKNRQLYHGFEVNLIAVEPRQ